MRPFVIPRWIHAGSMPICWVISTIAYPCGRSPRRSLPKPERIWCWLRCFETICAVNRSPRQGVNPSRSNCSARTGVMSALRELAWVRQAGYTENEAAETVAELVRDRFTNLHVGGTLLDFPAARRSLAPDRRPSIAGGYPKWIARMTSGLMS